MIFSAKLIYSYLKIRNQWNSAIANSTFLGLLSTVGWGEYLLNESPEQDKFILKVDLKIQINLMK